MTWDTIPRFLKRGALCREIRQGVDYAIEIAPFGRDYYRCEWKRYRVLYPDVDARRLTSPDEHAVVPGLAVLAQTSVRKPQD